MEGATETAHFSRHHSAHPRKVRSTLLISARSSIVQHLQRLWWYRLIVCPVFVVNTALVSAKFLPFRCSVFPRASLSNSKTYHCLLQFSSAPKSFGLSLPTSPTATADCRCIIPISKCLTSVASVPFPKKCYHTQRTFPFTTAKSVVDCFQKSLSGRPTQHGHERRWRCCLCSSSVCSTQGSSSKFVWPCGRQRYRIHTGMRPTIRDVHKLQNRILSGEEGSTARSLSVSKKRRRQELRGYHNCTSVHPLKDDVACLTTAFAAARSTHASCSVVMQQLEAFSAGAPSNSPLRFPPKEKSITQSKSLPERPEALYFSTCKLPSRLNVSVPFTRELLHVNWNGPLSLAQVKAVGCAGGGSDKCKATNVSYSSSAVRTAVGRPPFYVERSQSFLAVGHTSCTPSSGGAGEKELAESFIDVKSVRNTSRGHVADTSHQIVAPGEGGEPVGGVGDEFEKNRRRPPDRVLSGEKRGRLTVTLTNNHVHACVVDNRMQRTYAYASSLDRRLLPVIGVVQRRRGTNPRPHGATMKAAWAVGRLVAERALAKGIKKVFFDRKSYRYTGRVKALADGARDGGLDF